MTEKIMEMAAVLGKCEPDDALGTLCAAAQARLAAQLRPGLTPEDCGDAFVVAAAWTALADREAGEGGGVERFTAGAVTIQRCDAAQRAQALRLQARQVLRPYLRDEGFSFRGVAG